MNKRFGWAGAAILAAAFTMTTAPAMAQDGPQKAPKPAAKKKPKKIDWVAVKRAADKKREAEKKRRAAEKAAEEAEQAEAEAEEAAEDAQAPEEDAEPAADEPEDPSEEAAPDAEEDADDGHVPPPAGRGDGHHGHDHHHGVPSPERTRPAPAAPAYNWNMPHRMEYIEGAPVPDGYVKVERVRKGLVIGGAVTLGVSWLIASMAAAAIEEEETNPLFVPIVGPFITMGTTEADGGGRAGLLVNGIAQVAGAAMFISGLAATKTELVRTHRAELNLKTGVGNVALDGRF